MTSNLFTPLQLGELSLKNRIWMAPLTRCRADDEHTPTDLMAEHYAQRASAGLIIAEACMVMAGHSAFWREPGIYRQQQIVAWKKITDAVHANGGHIFLQLWHGGRACHPLLNNGQQPIAPSAIAIREETVLTPQGKQPYVIPRPLVVDELPTIVDAFYAAAKNAKLAGFDGVEIHGANGYLLDQFLRDGSNQREDCYGGSVENRARLLIEVIEAVTSVWYSQSVGVRISPLNSFNDMLDSDPLRLSVYLAEKLNTYSLGYLHVMRGDFYQKQQADILTPIRQHYQGILIGNMGYDANEANQAIGLKQVDAVTFGHAFIANPDLPERLRCNKPLNMAEPSTFYSAGYQGYTDYPFLS